MSLQLGAAPPSGGSGAPPGPRPPSKPRVRTARRPRSFTQTDVFTLVGCAASALALTWMTFNVLVGGGSWFGFLVVAYLVFLGLFALVTTDRLGRLVATDRVATVVIATFTVMLIVPLAWIIGYIVAKGLPGLTWRFFTSDQRGITPLRPATAGGGAHAIVGTFEQVGIALVLSVPIAISTAVFLNETRHRLRRPVRVVIDAMSGLPSVLAGLFIYTAIIIPYAKEGKFFGYNGLMAALALSLVMVPTITRTVEVVLRLVPDGLREAGLAVGASRARVVWSVVLPTARTGLTTAVILGIARAIGETAPLLFTTLGFSYMNANPIDGPQESLPLFIYRNIRNPSTVTIQRGATGALVLMMMVLSLFALARFIGRDRRPRGTRAPRRSATPARQS